MAHDTALSRRALLAISAAASASALARPAAGAPLPVPASVSPDAYLLGLCERWASHSQEYDAACQALSDAEGAAYDKHRDLGAPTLWSAVHADPAYMKAEGRVSGIVCRGHSLYQEIGQTRVVTLAGLLAKARITESECLEDGGIEQEASQYTDGVTPEYMALTLVRDLLAIDERGGDLDLPMSGGDA